MKKIFIGYFRQTEKYSRQPCYYKNLFTFIWLLFFRNLNSFEDEGVQYIDDRTDELELALES